MGVFLLLINYQKLKPYHHLIAKLPVFTFGCVLIYDITPLALTQYPKVKPADSSVFLNKIFTRRLKPFLVIKTRNKLRFLKHKIIHAVSNSITHTYLNTSDYH